MGLQERIVLYLVCNGCQGESRLFPSEAFMTVQKTLQKEGWTSKQWFDENRIAKEENLCPTCSKPKENAETVKLTDLKDELP